MDQEVKQSNVLPISYFDLHKYNSKTSMSQKNKAP